ncbi:phage portal protein [Oceanicaulis alexandrii]|uniref:phage portal protein n=1 Tax=Oceanicaulis alexandrii TaxID=153233 RepID=UPI003B50C834
MFRKIARAFSGKSAWTLSSPSEQLVALFGHPATAAGQAVTPKTAMRCAPVYASVKVLAESVAQLPLHLYRRDGEAKERATDHPLYALLHDAPNEWTSAAEFKQDMQTALCLHGNAFAFINRVGDEVRELVQIPSDRVQVLTDRVTMEPRYKVTAADDQPREYDRSEILHLRTIGTEPNVGLSPITQAREAIGLALAMEQHAGGLFGSGARPAGVLKMDRPMTPEALARVRESWQASHGGGENSGKTAILEGGLDFKPIQFSSVDLQFQEMRRWQIGEIARVFRIPLHMLQDLERTTHANAESMGRQFLTLTLSPWLELWEGAIKRSLLSAEERGQYYAEYQTDALARADLAQRFEAYAKAVTNGLLSPNEVRAAENRSPYPGGDQYRLPLNTEDAANGND